MPPIDHLIVYFYLISMLVLGLWVGRGVKDMKDYAIANRSYSSTIMMLTFLATVFGGGSTLGIAEGVHSKGIIMIASDMGIIFSFLLVAKYIAPRVSRFAGMISIGDMMGCFYGDNGRKLTGLLGFLYCIGMIAAQCKAIGYVLNATFGFNELYSTILGGSVLMVYATFGGVRSVTITDIFQFAILIVMIPLIANMAVSEVGGIQGLIAQVPSARLEVWNHERFWEVVVMFLVLGIFPAFVISPAPVQRMLMAKNDTSLSTIYYTSAMLKIPFNILVLFVGFAALIAFPNIDSGLAMPTIINETLPPVLRGLAITGILAVVMSTADSFLNSGAILMVHDFLKPVFNIKQKYELTATKIATAVMGVFAIYIAVFAPNILSIIFYADSLWGPLIVIPFVYCILGYKSSPRAFFTAAAITALIFIVTQIILPENHKYWSGLICIVVNAIFFLFFTKIYKNENTTIDPKYDYHLPKKVEFNLIKKLKAIFSLNVVKFIDNKVLQHGASPIAFAVFCCLSFIVPYFMWTQNTPVHYQQMLAIRVISGGLCIGLLLHSIWPKNFKKYFNLYWYFTLCFCLPFSTTVLASIQNFDMEWIVNISLSIFLLALLVDWLSFILIAGIGSFLGQLYFITLFPNVEIKLNSEQIYLTIYIVIFSTLIGLIFSRKRDTAVETRIKYIKDETEVVAHDLKTPLAGISGVVKMQESILANSKVSKRDADVSIKMDKYDFIEFQNSFKMIQKSVNKALVYIEAIFKYAKDSQNSEHNLKDCLNDSYQVFKTLKMHKGKVKILAKNDINFVSSKTFVTHMILNLFNNALKHAGESVNIEIKIEGNKLTFKDDGPGIDKADLPKIFNKGFSKAKSTGIGLSFCKTVMKEIGGSIKCKSEPGKFTEFILTF